MCLLKSSWGSSWHTLAQLTMKRFLVTSKFCSYNVKFLLPNPNYLTWRACTSRSQKKTSAFCIHFIVLNGRQFKKLNLKLTQRLILANMSITFHSLHLPPFIPSEQKSFTGIEETQESMYSLSFCECQIMPSNKKTEEHDCL